MKFYGIDSISKFFVQKVSTVVGLAHTGLNDEGRLLYNLTNDHLYTGSNTGWTKIPVSSDVYSTGTKLLFTSWPLPSSWTIDATYNDRMVVLTQVWSFVSAPFGQWTITGISTNGAHDHGYWTGAPYGSSVYAGKSDISGRGGLSVHNHSMYSDGNHMHTFDGAWRPEYVNTIIATYSG